MRGYNEHDCVCVECKAERFALWCTNCCTFTCTHYSLWGDDDERGPNDEQLVHRCNDCEMELSPYDEDASPMYPRKEDVSWDDPEFKQLTRIRDSQEESE